MTPAIFRRIRDRAQELRKSGIDGGAKIAETMLTDFSDFKIETLKDYVRMALGISDEVLKFYEQGVISFTVLAEFGQTILDPATMDFIAQEVVSRKMGLSDVRKIKMLLRENRHMSIAEVFGRISGEIPAGPKIESVRKVMEEFDSLLEEGMSLLMNSRVRTSHLTELIRKNKKIEPSLVKEAIKLLTDSRVKLSELIDLLPVSTLNKGKVHSELFHKAYLNRHLVKEQLDFVEEVRAQVEEGVHVGPDSEFPDHVRTVSRMLMEQFQFLDQKVKQYLDEIQKFVSMETQIAEKRKELMNNE